MSWTIDRVIKSFGAAALIAASSLGTQQNDYLPHSIMQRFSEVEIKVMVPQLTLPSNWTN